MERDLKRIIVQARAEIMWGTSVPSVIKWLRGEGLSESQIGAVITACTRERGVEIRRLGLRDTLIGGTLAVSGALAFVWGTLVENGLATRALTVLVLIGLYGIWLTWRGVKRLLLGARTKGSLTEM